MKIKQVEELVGITSKNIRFYESQGLLTPERAENGYREYHQKNIDTLKKIKLLRKLGVSVEEIKAVLNYDKTLEECLEQHKDTLKKECANLTNMQNLADAILQNQNALDGLQTDEWLDEMEKMEKEGVDFVNVSKIDVHRKKKLGAAIGGIFMIVLMAFFMGILLWGNSQEPLPPVLLVFLIGFPILFIVCTAVALRSRLKEIEGGEEDEAAKY